MTPTSATATNPFLDACGASGPLVLTVETPGAAADTRALDQPFALVGRDPRCDLRLDHDEVSDRHAYLQLVAGRLVCIDLGSRNGVVQGGRRSRLIDMDGDRPVRIGPYRVRLVAGDSPVATPTAMDPEREPTLVLSHRASRQSRCDLPPGLALVGSGPDCPIRLIDPSVSTYHCSLVRTPSGIWVVDLLGPGGLRVNGQEVGYARLHDGDVVQLGRSEVRLTSGSEPAPAPADPPAALATPADPTRLPPGPTTTAEWAPGLVSEAQAAEIVERALAPILGDVGRIRQQMVDDFQQARLMLFETFATLHREQSTFLSHELDQLRQLSQDLDTLRAEFQRQSDTLAARLGALSPPLPSAPAAAALPVLATTAPRLGSAVSIQDRVESARPESQDEAIHVQLCDRIARIKDEHQSRWKRLLGLFPSIATGKPTA